MKTIKKKIKIIVEKTDTGFSAYAVDYPIFTTGKSITDLIGNTFEASNLYYADQLDKVAQENLKFEFDFKQFFQSSATGKK